ncbi:MAG: hypothetical protein AAGJ10_04295 [Bacteroidota bacterium]
MKRILSLALILVVGLAGCAEAPLTGDSDEAPNATAEALVDADVLSIAVNGRALAPQELSLQLFDQPKTFNRRNPGGTFAEVVHPGETFTWMATLPDLGYVTMSIDGLIPQAADYQHDASWASIPFGERFDMDYSASACRIWQYRAAEGAVTDNPGTMRIDRSDAQRISGTFSAKLRLYQVSFFLVDADTCPDGIDSTKPSLDEITLSGSFNIERPSELPILRKLDDGRTITETWRAP